jgi:O-antigen ligase
MTGRIIIASLLLASLIGVLAPVSLWGINILPLDLVVAGIVLIGGAVSARSGRLTQTLKLPTVRYLLIFMAVILLSWVAAIPAIAYSGQALAVSLLYAIRLIGYLAVGIILIAELDAKSINLSRPLIIWAGVVLSCIGLAELALFPDFQIYDHLGWDPHKHRLIGTFLDPNFTAIWLAGVIGLILAGFHISASLSSRLRDLFAGLLLLAASFLTVSRSGLLALAGIFAAIGFSISRKWFWIIAVFGVLAVLLFPPLNSRLAGAINLDTTVRLRLNSWEGAATIIRQHPVLGVGYNTLKFRRYDSSLPGTSRLVSRFEDGVVRPEELANRADAGFDSSLLTLLATTGLVGLLAFLWWVWTAVVQSYRARQHNPAAVYSSWFLGFTAALFVSAWFVNAWFYPPILILWLIAWALSSKEQHV